MSEPKSQQEPSMEEILASIRRIISEDGTPGEEPGKAASGDAAEAEPVAEPAADDPEEEAVLELTQVVEDGERQEDDKASSVEAFAEVEEPVLEPAAAEPPRAPESPAAGLLSAAAAGAAESQLFSLVAAVDRAHAGTPIGTGNRTIEDLVKEVMRPMIKEWLDAHLPALVERMVRREVERLSRRAEGDE